MKQKSRRERVPNEVRRAATRQAVLSAARTLFVRNGYLRTTVDDIAGQAGISKGGIYFHFPDKADIVRELLLETAQLYRTILDRLQDHSAPPLDRLADYTNWVSRLGADDPDAMLLPILISFEFLGSGDEIERLVAAHYDDIYSALIAVIDDGRRQGVFNTRSSPREQAATIVSLSDGALLEWLRRSKALDGAKLVRALKQFIFDALLMPALHRLLPDVGRRLSARPATNGETPARRRQRRAD